MPLGRLLAAEIVYLRAHLEQRLIYTGALEDYEWNSELSAMKTSLTLFSDSVEDLL